MKKPTKDGLASGLQMYSEFYHIAFFTQHGKTNILCLDNNRNGNGEREYLHLKYEKDQISVCGGSLLTPQERKMVWRYKDFTDWQDLIEAISGFANKFAESFELKLVRK
jgi:hypothetical protein